MDKKTIACLVKTIKQKKELSGIDDSVVKDFLNQILTKYPGAKSKSDFKIIVSETRALLRKISGRFQKSSKERKNYLKKNDLTSLLKTHSSTAERIKFYPNLIKIINTEKPKSILDIGCGLNPLALASKKAVYYAVDIKKDELKIVEDYFKKNNISGRTFFYDLRKIDSTLPKADICLIFKVLDILGKNNHSLAKKIIQNLKCNIIIVSFSTRKLSGKPMSCPERIWFERILNDLQTNYEKIYSSNEVFYLIRKSSH